MVASRIIGWLVTHIAGMAAWWEMSRAKPETEDASVRSSRPVSLTAASNVARNARAFGTINRRPVGGHGHFGTSVSSGLTSHGRRPISR